MVEIPSVLTGIVIEIVPVHQFWFLELGLLVIWLVGILVRCVYTIIGRWVLEIIILRLILLAVGVMSLGGRTVLVILRLHSTIRNITI